MEVKEKKKGRQKKEEKVDEEKWRCSNILKKKETEQKERKGQQE